MKWNGRGGLFIDNAGDKHWLLQISQQLDRIKHEGLMGCLHRQVGSVYLGHTLAFWISLCSVYQIQSWLPNLEFCSFLVRWWPWPWPFGFKFSEMLYTAPKSVNNSTKSGWIPVMNSGVVMLSSLVWIDGQTTRKHNASSPLKLAKANISTSADDWGHIGSQGSRASMENSKNASNFYINSGWLDSH